MSSSIRVLEEKQRVGSEAYPDVTNAEIERMWKWMSKNELVTLDDVRGCCIIWGYYDGSGHTSVKEITYPMLLYTCMFMISIHVIEQWGDDYFRESYPSWLVDIYYKADACEHIDVCRLCLSGDVVTTI